VAGLALQAAAMLMLYAAASVPMAYAAAILFGTGWGLSWLINPEPGANGRSAGSLAWAGIFNSYYWIDPAKGLGGVFMAQLSPFGDPGALAAFAALERMAYA
jgi:CubicO group peptidase (beta-lactamase class C family)